MPGRRRFLRACGGVAVGGALAGCTGDGSDEPSGNATTVSPSPGFVLRSPAFADGEAIPRKYTADGDDVSPPLEIEGVPNGADTLTLIVDDPDAPDGPFYHWLCWNVPADTTRIPEGVTQARRIPDLGDARQGTNGFGELGYRGPRPPAGDDPHTYRFTLYAVSGSLNVQAGARYPTVDDALSGSVVASTRLTGEYGREE
ncbi:YbhB/YbcL family Raf kinase inhibitor-like protein [Halorientalis marina]|jgi:Raf kinase inhibitor-like YbhB/YbcL family protein|uniref:YbhB/YbcL family Raf kinase inhibitor-like protein n=1 Tax=Halorientalis marina TaxID=2931976 RepID=UPI001FF2F67B|nr:YbhB/YbcL family Raf kinase inhibitor-like protein [Halorientalis marina]